MSRMIICNKKEVYDKISRMNTKGGLIKSETIFKGDIIVETYYKRNFRVQNTVFIDDDFIACAGSLIYKDKIGEEGLREMYKDFSKENIANLRRELAGSYVVAIKKGTRIFIFVDEVGSYAYHYYYNDDVFLSTNTYYHIAKNMKTSINKLAFKERILEFCNIDNVSIFNGVFRLMGNEAIAIDIENNSMKVINIPQNDYTYKMENEQVVVKNFVELLVKYARKYKKFGRKILFTTGGVDSRVVLAVYSYLDELPIIANWQGAPVDMNTKIQDRKISKLLAEKCGLDFKCFDVSHDFKKDSKEIVDKLDTYGEYSLIYCGNKKWYEIFEKNIVDGYDFGYFGEVIKGWEVIDCQYFEGFTVDDYVKMYLNRNTIEISKTKDEKYDEFIYVREKIVDIAKQHNMDLNNLSKEDCMILYYVYRIHADTITLNYANIFAYSTNFYCEKEIADFVNQIPYKMKMNNRFNLLVTEKLNETLLDIPYFTHCQYKKYDNNKKILVDYKRNILRRWILQTPIGKHLRRVKSLNSYKKVSLELIRDTSFQQDTSIDLNYDEYFTSSMLYGLVGYATMIQNVLRMDDCTS